MMPKFLKRLQESEKIKTKNVIKFFKLKSKGKNFKKFNLFHGF